MDIRPLLLALALVACGQAAADEPAGSPLYPVERLYRDFAWEAVIDAPSAQTFLEQPDAVWRRYLSPALVELLRRDRDCVERTEEICQLDFDPIWASQDPGATQLKIATGGPGEARVSYVHPGGDQRIELTFSLVHQGSGWLIDDIRYADGSSLRALLAPAPPDGQ